MSESGPVENPELAGRRALVSAQFADRLSPERERDLASSLALHVDRARRLRAVGWTNADEPELRYRPVGEFDEAFSEGEAAAPLPLSESAPPRTIREIGRALRAGEITATELTEKTIAALECQGRELNAVAAITRERAFDAAARADQELRAGTDRGPLHGIPWAAKDLLAVAGYPTTWGVGPLREQHFEEDATVVTRLDEGGAIHVAKAAMVEFAGGFGYEQPDVTWTGPGRNAWNRDRWAGGSSSGSGSLVGAGILPFSIGSETFGSIIGPATYNGVTGLRPTYGRVSRAGAMALAWSHDKLGPIARTAEDCGIILSAIAGADPRDDTSVDARFDGRMIAIEGNARLAVPKGATHALQPEVEANFLAALDVLRDVATIEEVEFPDLPFSQAASVVIAGEGSAAFQEFVYDAEFMERLTDPKDRYQMLAKATVTAADYLNALRVRRVGGRQLHALLSGYDALVVPSKNCVAAPIEGNFTRYFDIRDERGDPPPVDGAANLCGLPAVTVPNGFGQFGLPTGIQFVGRAWSEQRILSVAHAYQLRTDWHTKVPEALR